MFRWDLWDVWDSWEWQSQAAVQVTRLIEACRNCASEPGAGAKARLRKNELGLARRPD
jgi:hypothetical protein